MAELYTRYPASGTSAAGSKLRRIARNTLNALKLARKRFGFAKIKLI